MATQKKSTSEAKDKPSTAKRTPGVTFDVLPPNKVMPSATSRPVITPSQPSASDNTLSQPGSAPLMHKPIAIQPAATSGDEPSDSDQAATSLGDELQPDSQDTVADAPSAPEVPSVLAETQPAGRSVSELLASKQAAAEAPEAPITSDTSEGESSEEPKASGEPEKPTAAKAPSSRGVTIKPPETMHADTADTTADDLSELAKPDEPARQTEPEAADDPLAEKTETSHELAEIRNNSPQPAEEQAPPELYGGKPVIVTHEPHPVRSAIISALLFLLMLALALVVFNFLLDAGVVSLSIDVPHTDLLEP